MNTPTGLTPERMAEVLGKVSGTTIDADTIAADVKAGAPTNADGTLNPVRYAAWLLKNGRNDSD
jgi:hypothetical protein